MNSYWNAVTFPILVLLCFLTSIHGEDCPPPKKIAEFEWNTTTTGESLYFPIGQRNDTSIIKQILYGSSLNADEDLTKLCYRMQLKDNNITLLGVNGTRASFNCKKIDPKKWILDCVSDDKKEEFNHKLYVTLTDKKTFAMAVRCWQTGLRAWTVFSTKKFLHDDVQIQILEHAKSLGFETANSLPLRYKQCPKN